MKHLKSFNKLNESLLDDILQGKMYQQIDDIDFDDIRIELKDTYGSDEFTESDIKTIRKIVNKYLCQDKTPFQIQSIEILDRQVLGQTNRNILEVQIKTGDIDYNCFIRIFKYGDDYFVLDLVIPLARYTKLTDSKSFISKTEGFYLIDGWDGFNEWSIKTTPYNKNTELFDLFTIPINDYKSGDKIRSSLGNTIVDQYYTIRDWSKKTNYFFDNGFHFGTMIQKNREDYFYGDGTLQQNGTRKI
jgi:hypothetical protein